MKKERFVLAFFTGCLISAVSLQAQTGKDSTKVARSYAINEVVVTGTRSETDVRHGDMKRRSVFRKLLGADCRPLFDKAVSALVRLSDTPYDLHRDS